MTTHRPCSDCGALAAARRGTVHITDGPSFDCHLWECGACGMVEGEYPADDVPDGLVVGDTRPVIIEVHAE